MASIAMHLHLYINYGYLMHCWNLYGPSRELQIFKPHCSRLLCLHSRHSYFNYTIAFLLLYNFLCFQCKYIYMYNNNFFSHFGGNVSSSLMRGIAFSLWRLDSSLWAETSFGTSIICWSLKAQNKPLSTLVVNVYINTLEQ